MPLRGPSGEGTSHLNRFITRLETGLLKLKENAEKSKRPDRQKVERRIGRLLERNSRAGSLFDVSVEERQTEHGLRLAVTIKKQEERTEWALHTSGSYLLRTNWHGNDPKELWKLYIQLTQAEDAFRTTKNDLGLRPVYHQTAEPTEAHILVCFLALANVADSSATDGMRGPRHGAEEACGGDARDQIARCGASGEGQKDQTPDGKCRPAGTEDTPSTVEAAASERAKGC